MKRLLSIILCVVLAFLIYSSIRRALAERAFLSAKRVMDEEPAVSRETVGEYGNALALMERAIRLNRGDASYHRWLGDLYFRYLPYAIELDMAGKEGFVEAGDRKLNAPQILMLAKDEFLRAENLEPTAPVPHLRLGAVNQILSYSFRGEGLAAEARSEFFKAWSLWPGSPYYNYVLGLFLVENGEMEEAVPFFQKAVRDKNALAYGVIITLGDNGMMAGDIKKVLPRDAAAYLELAVYLLEEGDHVGAEEAYGDAGIIRPLDEGEVSYYISTLRETGQFDKAIEMLNDELGKRPGDWRVYAVLGDIYLERKEWDMAGENYGMALKKCPATSVLKRQRSTLLFRRGLALMYTGDILKALEDMRSAQGADPSYPEGYFGEALCCMELNTEMEKAEEKLERAIALNPDDSRYYRYLAKIEEDLGKLDESVSLWKTGISRDPGNPKLHIGLAETYLKMGRIEEAKKHSATALDLSPHDSGIRKRAFQILGKK